MPSPQPDRSSDVDPVSHGNGNDDCSWNHFLGSSQPTEICIINFKKTLRLKANSNDLYRQTGLRSYLKLIAAMAYSNQYLYELFMLIVLFGLNHVVPSISKCIVMMTIVSHGLITCKIYWMKKQIEARTSIQAPITLTCAETFVVVVCTVSIETERPLEWHFSCRETLRIVT